METYIMQQFFGKIRLHRTALGTRQIGGNQRQVDCVRGSTATPLLDMMYMVETVSVSPI
jgi:hypothetical protein